MRVGDDLSDLQQRQRGQLTGIIRNIKHPFSMRENVVCEPWGGHILSADLFLSGGGGGRGDLRSPLLYLLM